MDEITNRGVDKPGRGPVSCSPKFRVESGVREYPGTAAKGLLNWPTGLICGASSPVYPGIPGTPVYPGSEYDRDDQGITWVWSIGLGELTFRLGAPGSLAFAGLPRSRVYVAGFPVYP